MRNCFIIIVLAALCAATAWAVLEPPTLHDRERSAEHVIVISIDGLSSFRLRETLEFSDGTQYPAIRRLMAEGACTFDARTDYDFTVTLPNHTCMLTSRPVLPPDGSAGIPQHGWTGNDVPLRAQTMHNQPNTGGTYIPSVFDVVHDHGLSTGLFASKEKFVLYEKSYNEQTGATDEVGNDDGQDKIDVFGIEFTTEAPETASPMCDALIEAMRQHRFNFTFVHIRDPDSAGHKYGWGSRHWRNAVADADGYLQRLFMLIDEDSSLRDNTAIIVTTDHGGRMGDHGNKKERLNYVIPFFVWGPGIAAGADLYALNATTRAVPPSSGAAARPSYSAPVQPIRNGDAGNLALQLLGLPPVSGSSINGSHDLQLR